MNNASKCKKILIFEPSHTGHYLKYVALIAEMFHKHGYDIIFASSTDTFSSIEYETFLRPCRGFFHPIKVPLLWEPKSFVIRVTMNSLNLARLIRETRPDLVFIPFLDSCFYVFGVLRRVLRALGRSDAIEIEGILFRGGFAYNEFESTIGKKFKTWLAKAIIRWGCFSRILILDEILYNFVKRDISDCHTQLCLCPDPIESVQFHEKVSFRKIYGIPADAKILGCFGVIHERKGIDLLVRAFLQYKAAETEYLLLVGKHSSNIKKMLAGIGAHSNIISIDRFVDDAELLSAINAADVIAATYRCHVGSASMVIRAAAAGKPILGSDFGWVGHTIRKYELGYVCDVEDEHSLLKGMSWAFNRPECNKQLAHLLAEMNSVESFEKLLLRV